MVERKCSLEASTRLLDGPWQVSTVVHPGLSYMQST